MVAMQRDILEMIQQLPQKIGDTEAHITNSIDIKCSALEDNVKQYINSVVFAYIDNLMHHVIIPTTDSTSHSSQASETVSLANEETSGDLNGDRETNINSKEHKDGETTTLTGFEPAITRPKLPIHDVYIGGATPTTTEDDLRVYLLKIGITPESIMSIECISGGDPQSSSFRVKICEISIKDTVYNTSNFKAGIIIKPYRFHQRYANGNSGENIYPSYVPHSRNRNKDSRGIQEDDHRTIVSSRDTNGSWGKHAHSRDTSRQRMTYDRTRDRSRHTEYSRPQHTSRRNENRETRDMSETRHRYNRTRSPRDVSESRNRYNQTYEHNCNRSARGAINYYEPQQQNFMTNQMHQQQQYVTPYQNASAGPTYAYHQPIQQQMQNYPNTTYTPTTCTITNTNPSDPQTQHTHPVASNVNQVQFGNVTATQQ